MAVPGKCCLKLNQALVQNKPAALMETHISDSLIDLALVVRLHSKALIDLNGAANECRRKQWQLVSSCALENACLSQLSETATSSGRDPMRTVDPESAVSGILKILCLGFGGI